MRTKLPKSSRYQCNLCGQIVWRQSAKQWVKSICYVKDSFSRLYRVGRKVNEKG